MNGRGQVIARVVKSPPKAKEAAEGYRGRLRNARIHELENLEVETKIFIKISNCSPSKELRGTLKKVSEEFEKIKKNLSPLIKSALMRLILRRKFEMSELFEEKIMRFSEEEIKKLERELFSHGITWNEFEEHYQARKWYELPASEVTCLAVNEIEPKNSELAQLCTKLFAFSECALDTLQKAKLNVLKDFIFEAFGKVRGMSKWKKADFVQYAFKRFSEKYAEKPETEAEGGF